MKKQRLITGSDQTKTYSHMYVKPNFELQYN